MFSAVIITKNEEQCIEDCLSSIIDVVDEVVIVDAESADRTVEISKAYSEKVVVHVRPWEGYGAARNYGAQQAKHNWIYSIDADERCDEELRFSLSSLDPKADTIYQVVRVNVYRNKAMRYGMLKPETKMRLYHREAANWDDVAVHESLTFDTQQLSTSRISGTLHHHLPDDKDAYVSKLEKYAELSASQWHQAGRRPNRMEEAFAAPYHLLRNYIWKAGFLDLRYGWETSMIAMRYHAEKYRQYRLLQS